MGGVVDFVEDVAGGIGDVVEGIGDVVGDVVEPVMDVVNDAADSIMSEVVDPVVTAVDNTITAAMEDPIGTAATIGTAIVAPHLLPVVNGLKTIANGGDLQDAFESAAKTYVAQNVGQYVAGQVGTANTYGTDIGSQQTEMLAAQDAGLVRPGYAGSVAGQTAAGIVQGKDPFAAFAGANVSSLVPIITNEIPEYKDLSPALKRAVDTAVSATIMGGDLSQSLVNAAINQGIVTAREGLQEYKKTSAYLEDQANKFVQETKGRDATPEELASLVGMAQEQQAQNVLSKTFADIQLAAGEGFNLGQAPATDKYGFTNEQKTQFADFLQNSAKFGDSGITLTDDGTYMVNDPSNGVVHYISADGTFLGSAFLVDKEGNTGTEARLATQILSNTMKSAPEVKAKPEIINIFGDTRTEEQKQKQPGLFASLFGGAGPGTSGGAGMEVQGLYETPFVISRGISNLGDATGDPTYSLFGAKPVNTIVWQDLVKNINPDAEVKINPDGQVEFKSANPDNPLTDDQMQKVAKIAGSVSGANVSLEKPQTIPSTVGGGGGGGGGGTAGRPSTELPGDFISYLQGKGGFDVDFGSGSGTGAGIGTGTGIGTGAGTGGGQGQGTGTGIGSGTGSGVGTGVGTGVGSGTGAGTGAGSGGGGGGGGTGIGGGGIGTTTGGRTTTTRTRSLTQPTVAISQIPLLMQQMGLGDDTTKPIEHQVGKPTGSTAYEGLLSNFIEEVEANRQTTDNPEQSGEDERLSMPTYFNYGEETPVDQILAGGGQQSVNPMEGQPQNVTAYAQGGLTMGVGTRYGRYAGGGMAAPLLMNSGGKTRVDFRRGDAVTGPGDGQSDDIPAMLADGEFVFPADVVAAIGNGSTKAGSDALYDMMHSIRAHVRSAKPEDLPPEIKSPLEFLKSKPKKRG